MLNQVPQLLKIKQDPWYIKIDIFVIILLPMR